MKAPSTDEAQLGLFFSDGQRRVDYVLTYLKSGGTQKHSSKLGDNCLQRLCLNMRGSRAPLQPKEDPEVAAQIDYREDDERFKREEFEENLRKTGLELEKDEKVRMVRIEVRVLR